MKKQLRIVLYGNTLVLAGMRLSLEANPAFEVIPFSGPDANGQELLALRPDVVIFDTSSVQPQLHYDRIESCLQLIGIDPDRGQVLVWSGQHLDDLSVPDLVEILCKERRGEPVSLNYQSNNQSNSKPNRTTDSVTRGHGDAENLSSCHRVSPASRQN